NILVDADGTPHIADFGLAKRVEGSSHDATCTGAIVGTPSYMAPEQARSQRDLTIAVDVYALGAILYELLTGRPPFRGKSPLATVQQFTTDEAPRPGALTPTDNRVPEPICRNSLEKEPARRYESAAALADDLERWLKGEPIQARPNTTLERILKWSKRNPATAALVAVSAAALVTLLAVISGSSPHPPPPPP